MTKEKYPRCLVCGFDSMPYAPVPFNICPCCSVEYGVDDKKVDHPKLRQNWIAAGMPWFDDITSPPSNWSPVRQLLDAGYGSDLIIPNGSVTAASQVNVSLSLKTIWSPADLAAYTVIAGAA